MFKYSFNRVSLSINVEKWLWSSGFFHKIKIKWIQFWAMEDYFLPGCLLCWQMRMSTTSRSGHQQEIAPEKWLSYYFRTLTDWGKEEWQRNISQRFNNPRHFQEWILIRSWAISMCGVCRSWLRRWPANISGSSPQQLTRSRSQSWAEAQSFTVYFKHLLHLCSQ